ncbi:uncharacterized protein LOC109546996 [Dendroctonus ponderosae]|uniref:uncharacterized protein LOC109546996 n=1 Tax=Dendroctonus ponderosae TaxID=77166 RepID=UPI002034F87A|nr:uncharacterized protein LOC109546996 [Dendroctonus ponderosae]XP_048525204.1 uncharacterized protein LOC109546996 [Dendroctonus ponderosae]KAH1010664.1 hypothetical protein HUJ05_004921 [Dendroctonus ponderosae]
MDIEDDLEILEDKTQQYLLAKFEELKLQNEELQAELNDNQQELSKSTFHDGNSLQISDIWKRILSYKCVLGFEVNSPEGLKNVNLMLTIDNEPNLTYTIKIFQLSNEENGESAKDSRYCRKDELISKSIYRFNENSCDNAKHVFVTASFDFPPFLHKHIYVIHGNIQCGTKAKKLFNCPFPRVEFSVDDALQNSLCYEINSMSTLLTSVSCYNVREFALKTTEFPVDYRSALQSHCPLTYVPFKSGGYFLSDKTPLFGHLSIVILNVYTFENHSILNFKIFAEKRQQYVLLTHSILQCLKNIVDDNRPRAVNHDFELIQREHETTRTLNDFITELKEECDNLSGFFEKSLLNARLLLNDIESKSDSTYAQVRVDG